MRYRVKLSLLVVLLLPLLIKLGFWQLSRYQEKLELEQTLSERQTMSALGLTDVSRYADSMYLPVSIRGRFFSTRAFFLDNQVHEGRAGYDLIMPFKTDDNRWLLINRGWMPAEGREKLPDILTPEGEIELTGKLYRLLGTPFMLGEDVWKKDWPKRIQAINFERMGKAVEQSLPFYILRLAEHQPGAYQVRPLAMKTTSQKHLGYAIQWFLMALVLLGLYLWQMRSHREPEPISATGRGEK
ncbi:hypothetical protein GZ78_22680 [Endozoicomonas numazuensis]|uniref:SURF1-like protein n=2 Tax=Endozoicomonas numazuensis TaxID=1137799 RepID=A0A081NDW0_9GAMM|nr:hypothetical protein GZ78_22680 [Endozoicomonas numazuensis]